MGRLAIPSRGGVSSPPSCFSSRPSSRGGVLSGVSLLRFVVVSCFVVLSWASHCSILPSRFFVLSRFVLVSCSWRMRVGDVVCLSFHVVASCPVCLLLSCISLLVSCVVPLSIVLFLFRFALRIVIRGGEAVRVWCGGDVLVVMWSGRSGFCSRFSDWLGGSWDGEGMVCAVLFSSFLFVFTGLVHGMDSVGGDNDGKNVIAAEQWVRTRTRCDTRRNGRDA